jgi:hypothetical protein
VTYVIPAKFVDSTATPGPCPTKYKLDSAGITNTHIRALVTFDATTDTISIAGGTDDTDHKAAMGFHTIKL